MDIGDQIQQLKKDLNKDYSYLRETFERDIRDIKQSLDKIERRLSQDYITRIEFDPIKKIVYGLVSLILVGVVGALLGLVIR